METQQPQVRTAQDQQTAKMYRNQITRRALSVCAGTRTAKKQIEEDKAEDGVVGVPFEASV